MIHIKYLALAIILSTFVCFGVNSNVHAASESAVVVEKDIILQKESLESEISTVKETYRGQLETYRRDEKEYKIAIDQYNKHQTLVSIERAVAASKQAMASRNNVLITYMTLLKLHLLDSEGVEISEKDITLRKLDATLENLKRFQINIEAATEREQINSLATVFNSIGDNTSQVAEEALVLLSLGELQAIYDKALPIQKEIDSFVSTNSAKISDDKKKRAIKELSKTTADTGEELELVWLDIAERREEDQVYTMYLQITQKLNPIYAKLSKVSSYMEEIFTL